MAKVLPFFLYIIITHTHIVCAVKSEADEAMAKDLRMAVEVNSEADETILGFDAQNRKEATTRPHAPHRLPPARPPADRRCPPNRRISQN